MHFLLDPKKHGKEERKREDQAVTRIWRAGKEVSKKSGKEERERKDPVDMVILRLGKEERKSTIYRIVLAVLELWLTEGINTPEACLTC